jgi:hypothetical protein
MSPADLTLDGPPTIRKTYIPEGGVWTRNERDPDQWAQLPALAVDANEMFRAIRTFESVLDALVDATNVIMTLTIPGGDPVTEAKLRTYHDLIKACKR